MDYTPASSGPTRSFSVVGPHALTLSSALEPHMGAINTLSQTIIDKLASDGRPQCTLVLCADRLSSTEPHPSYPSYRLSMDVETHGCAVVLNCDGLRCEVQLEQVGHTVLRLISKIEHDLQEVLQMQQLFQDLLDTSMHFAAPTAERLLAQVVWRSWHYDDDTQQLDIRLSARTEPPLSSLTRHFFVRSDGRWAYQSRNAPFPLIDSSTPLPQPRSLEQWHEIRYKLLGDLYVRLAMQWMC